VDPPDRRRVRGLEEALGELSKLELGRLQGIPGAQDAPLSAQLDHEQDRILETLFRLHSDAGWFAAPPLPEGPGQSGLLSVLIPVHGQAQLTAACLKALRDAGGGPMEVIVVDNGSTDGTRALLQANPWVRSLRVERNLGFARATNLAAQRARGEFLVLLNNDTEVRPGWDAPIRDELACPATGAVGLRLLYPDGSIQHAGLAFGPDGLPWHVYRGFPAEAPEVMRRRSMNAVTGACMALRRDTWQKLGALDENFINCYEDVDLCLRLRQAGLEVVYRPDGCVVHHEGRTEGRGDHVTHSWLVLQEKWAGRLPFDEDEILREDGWRAVREGGTLVLKRRGVAGDPQEDLSRALALLESGHTGRARVHLERALPHLDAEARRDVQSLLTQLPAMPARGSVAAHRPAMESGPGVL
jgi:GT2 family glycosyltransferase